MEAIRLEVIQAAVKNESQSIPAPVAAPTEPRPAPIPGPVHTTPHLTTKTIRLPADLAEFIDFVYTKERRMRKQDAYTEALEAFFRPLMPH